jgi:hypothetical protein
MSPCTARNCVCGGGNAVKPEEFQIMYQVEDTLWWYRGMEAIPWRVIERFYPHGEGLRCREESRDVLCSIC